MKDDDIRNGEFVMLTEEQQKEILERDRQYEAGDAEVFSLNEAIAHLGVKINSVS